MINDSKKLLTFSFDDGVIDDIRLVSILNKYGLKATFNINSALISNINKWNYDNKKTVTRLDYAECKDLYNGHEIASHGYTHPNLIELDYKTAYNEIFLDIKILENLFSCKIRGFAYPFGTHDDKAIEILKEAKIEYARGVNSTYSFDFPKEPLVLEPSAHFMDEKLSSLVEEFLSNDNDQPKLLYIWGHSYELVTEEDWMRFENICKNLSNRDDVYYCTNIEAIDFINKSIKE